MAESMKTTMKQALQITLGLLAFALLCSFLPGTGAYGPRWYAYWGGVLGVAGLISLLFYVGRAYRLKHPESRPKQ